MNFCLQFFPLNFPSEIYENFTVVAQRVVLDTISSVTQSTLAALDKAIAKANAKVKRQQFKKLLSGIIGVNIGQALRRSVDIQSLPEKLVLASKQLQQQQRALKQEDDDPLQLDALFDQS